MIGTPTVCAIHTTTRVNAMTEPIANTSIFVPPVSNKERNQSSIRQSIVKIKTRDEYNNFEFLPKIFTNFENFKDNDFLQVVKSIFINFINFKPVDLTSQQNFTQKFFNQHNLHNQHKAFIARHNSSVIPYSNLYNLEEQFTNFFNVQGQKFLEFYLENPANYHFENLEVNRYNLERVRAFYDNNFKPRKGEAILTFQAKSVTSYIQELSKNWATFGNFNKNVIWQILVGFKDYFDTKSVKEAPKKVITSTEIDAYIEKEVALSRVLELPKTPTGNFMAPSVFSIIEHKFENGVEYEKIRYVNNNIICNEVLKMPAKSLEYRFPTAESLFLFDNLYDALIKSSGLSTIDKTDYFRQWFVYPDNYPLAIIKIKNSLGETKYYQNLRGRMGSTYASFHSQSLSMFCDQVYFDKCKHFGAIPVTLMDDTILLNLTEPAFDKLCEVNSNLNLELNPRKQVKNDKIVKWAGYLFDCENNLLAMPTKKLDKIKTQITTIISILGVGVLDLLTFCAKNNKIT